MMERGPDLYRSKGILSVRGTDEKFVFQAVHMMMNLDSSSNLGMKHKPWQEGEKRINKFCFIGKNLDKEQMINDLRRCIFNEKVPDPGPVPTVELNHEVGDVVKCKYEDEWVNGVISQIWYREELWETGRYVPYQVLLVNGKIALVPRDSETFIKPIHIEHNASDFLNN